MAGQPAGNRVPLVVLAAVAASTAASTTLSCNDVLAAVYGALNGPQWTKDGALTGGTTWLDSTKPCCEKDFVECEENPTEVTRIDFRAIGRLKGTLPAELGQLASLRKLDLVKLDDVSGTLPPGLFQDNNQLKEV